MGLSFVSLVATRGGEVCPFFILFAMHFVFGTCGFGSVRSSISIVSPSSIDDSFDDSPLHYAELFLFSSSCSMTVVFAFHAGILGLGGSSVVTGMITMTLKPFGVMTGVCGPHSMGTLKAAIRCFGLSGQ